MKKKKLGKIVLYVGNLKEAKGIFDLLESFLIMNMKHTRLIYIGSGHDRKRLLSLIEYHKLSEKVEVIGPFHHNIIAEWMRRSDVLCLPSHNEGVPNVILESMACGTPVVATNVGGIPEILSSGSGYTVPVKNPSVLAERLKDALEKDWDRDEISNLSKRYDWDETASKIFTEIKEVLFDSME